MNAIRLFDPASPQEPRGEVTVRQVVDWYLARAKSSSADALHEKRRVLSLFADAFGNSLVSAMDGADLVEFVATQTGVKALWTVNRWYRTIKQPFSDAERLRRIPSPFHGVRLPRGDRGRDLTWTEFRTLLRMATPAFRRVLLFLHLSGARPGELRRLTRDDLRLEAKSIVLRRHKTERTQREPRPRVIRLTPVLVKLLCWLLRRADRWLFTNSYGGQWTTRALCQNLARLRAKAELAADVKLYGTRHMYACNAILNGVDIATLAELMGHTDTKTTQWYIHLAGKDDYLADAAERAVRKR